MEISHLRDRQMSLILPLGLVKSDEAFMNFIWCGDSEDRHYLTSTNIEVTGWLT